MIATERPGYQQTPLGWLPFDWKVQRLSSLAKTYAGGTPDRSKPEYFEGDIPWVKSGEVNLRKITRTEERISKIALAESSAKLAEVGAVLIAMYGATAGKVARLKIDAAINQAVLSIRSMGDELDNDFLFWVMESSAEKLLSMCQGAAQPNLNKGIIDRLEIATPPLPEQQKIAAILATADDKLDVIARQIDAYKTLKKGLLQTFFSQGIGIQAAADWPTVALYEVAEIRTGVAKGKKGLREPVELPYLRVANVQDGHIDLTEVKAIEVEATNIERYALQPGDVLMTEGGDFDKLGRGDVWEGQISPCLHQNHVFAVRPDPSKLNSYYLAALAASDIGRQYFLSCAKRTTNLASINSSQLKAFPVLLPPLAQQEAIAEIVAAANAKVASLKSKQSHYQSLKRGLMQKLLTGEWRVSVDACAPIT